MDQSKPSFFITTPIYYVNADPLPEVLFQGRYRLTPVP